jgi:hypothetical protein
MRDRVGYEASVMACALLTPGLLGISMAVWLVCDWVPSLAGGQPPSAKQERPSRGPEQVAGPKRAEAAQKPQLTPPSKRPDEGPPKATADFVRRTYQLTRPKAEALIEFLKKHVDGQIEAQLVDDKVVLGAAAPLQSALTTLVEEMGGRVLETTTPETRPSRTERPTDRFSLLPSTPPMWPAEGGLYLGPTRLRLALVAAQTELAQAEDQLRIVERLRARGYVSEPELAARRRATEAARQKVEAIRQDLELAVRLLELERREAELLVQEAMAEYEYGQEQRARYAISEPELVARQVALERAKTHRDRIDLLLQAYRQALTELSARQESAPPQPEPPQELPPLPTPSPPDQL